MQLNRQSSCVCVCEKVMKRSFRIMICGYFAFHDEFSRNWHRNGTVWVVYALCTPNALCSMPICYVICVCYVSPSLLAFTDPSNIQLQALNSISEYLNSAHSKQDTQSSDMEIENENKTDSLKLALKWVVGSVQLVRNSSIDAVAARPCGHAQCRVPDIDIVQRVPIGCHYNRFLFHLWWIWICAAERCQCQIQRCAIHIENYRYCSWSRDSYSANCQPRTRESK